MTAAAGALARRRRLMRRVGVGIGATVLLGSIAILPILPWVMGIVTDARHVYTATVPPDNRGAYLVTDDGVMQLFTWHVQPEGFPADAPTLELGSVRAATIVQKQFAEPDSYRLLNLATGQPVEWASSAAEGMHLTLRPAGELPRGEYMLIVPSDGMFGGNTLHYFRLERAGEDA